MNTHKKTAQKNRLYWIFRNKIQYRECE